MFFRHWAIMGTSPLPFMQGLGGLSLQLSFHKRRGMTGPQLLEGLLG